MTCFQDDLNEEIRYARTEVVDLEDDAAALPYGRTETLEVEAEKTPTPPPPGKNFTIIRIRTSR